MEFLTDNFWTQTNKNMNVASGLVTKLSVYYWEHESKINILRCNEQSYNAQKANLKKHISVRKLYQNNLQLLLELKFKSIDLKENIS